MTILVTNDDGYFATGIAALVEVAQKFGNVIVVSPDKPQSGMGHAITVNQPIMIEEIKNFGKIPAYKISGTPVDCVKLARDKILHTAPDLCLSGINHGNNNSINVIYSGTMSAAVEASIEDIPAIGFSLLDYSPDADFSAAQQVVEQVIEKYLKQGLLHKYLLNVNIPKLSFEKIKGHKVCRQAKSKWVEEYLERETPSGKKYYWLTGQFQNLDKGTDTDVYALENGYVSIVPVQYDLTAHHQLTDLSEVFE